VFNLKISLPLNSIKHSLANSRVRRS